MVSFPVRCLLVLCLIVLAAGCTKSSGRSTISSLAPEDGSDSGTIVWLADPTADTATDDVRENLANAFEQAYPSIKIQLETGPSSTDSLRSMLVSELSTGASTPDVYDGDVVWPYAFAHGGLALPLSKYLPSSFWKTFATSGGSGTGASMVRAMTYHGAIYGIPEFIDEGFLYYRKDLLDHAGLKPPHTWEQLVADSMALKRDHLPYQFVWQGNNYEGLTCDWYEFMADAFGVLRPSVNPAAELDSPQAFKALDFLRYLISGGISPRNVDTFEETDGDSAFDNGNAAFLRGWDSSYANATSTASLIPGAADVGVEAPPTFQGHDGPGWSTLGGWGIFINPHSRNLRADLTFAKWMAGTEAQWILATQYSLIPANASVRDNPAVIAANPVLRAAAGTRVVLRPAATTNYQRVSDAIHDNINAALPGPSFTGIAPCAALIRAARAIDPRVVGTLRCPGGPSSHG